MTNPHNGTVGSSMEKPVEVRDAIDGLLGGLKRVRKKLFFAQYVGLTKDNPEVRASAPLAIDLAKENILKLIV